MQLFMISSKKLQYATTAVENPFIHFTITARFGQDPRRFSCIENKNPREHSTP